MSEKPTYEELENRLIVLERNIAERRQAEQSLRESGEKYKTILTNIADGYFEIDLAGNFTFFNNSMCKILGYPKGELAGVNNRQYMSAGNAKKIFKAFNWVYKTGRSFKASNWELIRKDGSKCHIEASVALTKNSEGRPIGFRGIAHDITDHLRSVEEVKSAKSFLDMVVDMSPFAMWISDRRGTVLRTNRSLREALDIADKDIVGKYNVLNDANLEIQGVMPMVKAVFENHEPARFIIPWEAAKAGNIDSKGARNLFIDVSMFPIISAEGDLSNVVCQWVDITERRQAEAERKRLQAQLTNAIEIARLGHWEYDVINDLFTFNDHFYKMFRTTAENVGGYKMSSAEYASRFVHPDDMSVVRKEVQKSIEAADSSFSRELEHRIIYGDGTVGHIIVKIFIVKDSKGRTVRTYGVNQDITERKRIEKELLKARKMESIGNLAGGIAHDFNNILSSIIGYTELALDDVEKGSMLEDSLQEIYKAGKRARDLVKQILAFARQSDEQRKPIKVATVANEVFKLIRSTIPTNITTKQNIESHCRIMGNPTQVHQLFMNLCTNAAQAMENAGGVLELAVKDITIDQIPAKDKEGLQPAEYVEIKVSDTGSGIAPEIIDSIFEPYFTTKDPGEGTGMGLALAHGIVESYGGKITVASEFGKGAVFSVYLPTTKGHKSDRRYGKEKLPTGIERILFVDDELPIAKMGSQILERLGYQVTMRTSSVEALELFRSKPDYFDLVITDMTMPNMTGDKLAMELIAYRSNIPVILCTGYSKKITDEGAARIGIKAICYKPIVRADLAKTVREILDGTK